MITDDSRARQIASFRQDVQRERDLAKKSRLTLDQLHVRMAQGEVKEVPVVLKADVQGSTEVLGEMLGKLETSKVRIRIIHAAVGAITEYDVLLAATSNGSSSVSTSGPKRRLPRSPLARRSIFDCTR